MSLVASAERSSVVASGRKIKMSLLLRAEKSNVAVLRAEQSNIVVAPGRKIKCRCFGKKIKCRCCFGQKNQISSFLQQNYQLSNVVASPVLSNVVVASGELSNVGCCISRKPNVVASTAVLPMASRAFLFEFLCKAVRSLVYILVAEPDSVSESWLALLRINWTKGFSAICTGMFFCSKGPGLALWTIPDQDPIKMSRIRYPCSFFSRTIPSYYLRFGHNGKTSPKIQRVY
jgi:hypothetical protein